MGVQKYILFFNCQTFTQKKINSFLFFFLPFILDTKNGKKSQFLPFSF